MIEIENESLFRHFLVILILAFMFISCPAKSEQPLTQYWEKYLDEKFKTMNDNLIATNKNIDDLKEKFIDYKDRTNAKISEQDKCISGIEKEMEIERYIIYGILGMGFLGGGSAYIKSKRKNGNGLQ